MLLGSVAVCVSYAMQVSDCNLRVDLYAAGGWPGLSYADRVAVIDYGSAFRKQLQPIMESEVNHGGFIMPCLVHCVSGYAFWGRGLVGNISPSAAFLMWYDCFVLLAFPATLRFAIAWPAEGIARYSGNSSAWTVDSCDEPSCNPTCVYLRW